MSDKNDTPESNSDAGSVPNPADSKIKKPMPKEINGPKGPEPTRYGDWEKNGIASDF